MGNGSFSPPDALELIRRESGARETQGTASRVPSDWHRAATARELAIG